MREALRRFIVDVAGDLASDERVQQAIKNVLGALITERILPLVPVAAASAAKAAMDQVIARFPGIEDVAEAAVDVVEVGQQVRTDLNDLIPDFDIGVPALDNLLDFWRPR